MEEIQAGKIPSSVDEMPAHGDALQAARERLNQTLAGVGEQAKQAAQYADQAVYRNPWTSVGIGFGVGVLVGALIAIAAGSKSSRLL